MLNCILVFACPTSKQGKKIKEERESNERHESEYSHKKQSEKLSRELFETLHLNDINLNLDFDEKFGESAKSKIRHSRNSKNSKTSRKSNEDSKSRNESNWIEKVAEEIEEYKSQNATPLIYQVNTKALHGSILPHSRKVKEDIVDRKKRNRQRCIMSLSKRLPS